MANKFGKFLMAAVTIGAAAAGVYYVLQKKDDLSDGDFDDDEDFDDFDEDLDDEEDSERKYVDLDLANAPDSEAADFKEGLDAAKAEATDKVVGAAGSAAKAADNAKTKVEEFFDDDDDSSLDAM